MAPVASIRLFPEDKAKGSHQAIIRLLQRMLLQIDPYTQTQRIPIEPTDDDDMVLVMRANRWKEKGGVGADDRRRLIRTIATELLRGDNHFVAVHIDGDRRWGERATSENLQKWSRQVERPLRDLIRDRRGAEHVGPAMSRLFLVTPFYSLEAWTYQHTREARARCCGRHAEEIEGWAHDRGLLDEVLKPKEHLCLEDMHNAELASGRYPADEVLRAGKSWWLTAFGLASSPDLRRALRASWSP